jgi:hypothetical protein
MQSVAKLQGVTVFCLTDQGQWTDDYITDVSVTTYEIIFETQREGLCGIFPQTVPAVIGAPSPTWIPTQTAIPR